MGTPINLIYYGADLLSSFALSALLDRPDGAAPRKSEFFTHALFAGVSGLVWGMIPPSLGIVKAAMGAVDRAMWRAAWMALVDDLVKVLAYPDTESKTGKALVVGIQALLILFSVLWVFFMVHVGRDEMVKGATSDPRGKEDPIPEA